LPLLSDISQEKCTLIVIFLYRLLFYYKIKQLKAVISKLKIAFDTDLKDDE